MQEQRPYEAPGEDGIQNKHQKKTNQKMIIQLYHIYKKCKYNNYYANCWKKNTYQYKQERQTDK